MSDILIDSLIDTIKLIPFLLITFLILELIEHKLKNKTNQIISTSDKFGPIIASFLGILPQCGFSVMATNLYATRIITLGTLISVYLSTSDEMLPLLLAHKTSFHQILTIIGIKITVAIISGSLIDLLVKEKSSKTVHDFCDEEHCHCEKGIIPSSIKHTLQITIFILIANLILNTILSTNISTKIQNILETSKYIAPFFSSLVGLIPNCGSSVLLTELYLSNIINQATLLAGLLTGSGVALLVLFRTNKNLKETLKIILILYLIGSLTGLILQFI